MPFTGDENRKIFRPEAITAAVQEKFAQDLVVSKVIPTEDIEEQVFSYLVLDPSNAYSGAQNDPEDMVLGQTDFPDITFKELDDAKGKVAMKGWKFAVSPQRLHYSANVLNNVELRAAAIERFARWFERGAMKTATKDFETAKGTEFDNSLTEATGGYATDGKHIKIATASGKAWNEGGDPVQQLSEITHVMRNHGRIANANGNYRMNPRTSTAFVDPNTFTALNDVIRDHQMATTPGYLPGSVVVNELYGLTFVEADLAFTNADGTAKNGHMVIIDRTQVPLQRFQSLPPLETTQGPYVRTPSQVGPDLMVKDLKHDGGGLEVRMWSQEAVVKRKPKGILHVDGLWVNQ